MRGFPEKRWKYSVVIVLTVSYLSIFVKHHGKGQKKTPLSYPCPLDQGSPTTGPQNNTSQWPIKNLAT